MASFVGWLKSSGLLYRRDSLDEMPNVSKVIVVGGGLAGLVASIEASCHGAEVVIIDKAKAIGGNSMKASSGINGACTAAQEENGVKNDSMEEFMADTMKSGDNMSDPALVEVLVHNSSNAIEWLESFGIKLRTLSQCGGHSHPRTHRIPPGEDGRPIPVGFGIMSALKKYIQEEMPSIKIVTETRVVSLITEELPSGDVIVNGIKYERERPSSTHANSTDSGDHTAETDPIQVIQSSHMVEITKVEEEEEGTVRETGRIFGDAVVLTTGGYAYDRGLGQALNTANNTANTAAPSGANHQDISLDTSLLRRFAPQVATLATTSGPEATGDGVKLCVRSCDALLVGMDKVQVHPTGFVELPPLPPMGSTTGDKGGTGSGGIPDVIRQIQDEQAQGQGQALGKELDPPPHLPLPHRNPSKFLAPEALRGCGGLLVNHRGERFVDELGRRDHISQAIFQYGARAEDLASGGGTASSGGASGSVGSVGSVDGPIMAYMLLTDEVIDSFGRGACKFYQFKKLLHGPFHTTDEVAAFLKIEGGGEALWNTLVGYEALAAAAAARKMGEEEVVEGGEEEEDVVAGTSVDVVAYPGKKPPHTKAVFPVTKWTRTSSDGETEAEAATEAEGQPRRPIHPLYVAAVTPCIHYTMGGLKINSSAEVQRCRHDQDSTVTSIGGLYAAGEVTGGVHGANRLAGNSLLECVVFGRRAGRRAAEIVLDRKQALTPSQYRRLRFRHRRWIGRNGMCELSFELPSTIQTTSLRPGEYISVKAVIDGEEIKRFYSPISRPDDYGHIDLLVKIDDSGTMSKFLRGLVPSARVYTGTRTRTKDKQSNASASPSGTDTGTGGAEGADPSPLLVNLPINSSLEFAGPMGGFDFSVTDGPPHGPNYIGMLAGGCGISPMVQIIRAVLFSTNNDRKKKDGGSGTSGGDGDGKGGKGGKDGRTRPRVKLKLLWACEEEGDLVYRGIMDRMMAKHADVFEVVYSVNKPNVPPPSPSPSLPNADASIAAAAVPVVAATTTTCCYEVGGGGGGNDTEGGEKEDAVATAAGDEGSSNVVKPMKRRWSQTALRAMATATDPTTTTSTTSTGTATATATGTACSASAGAWTGEVGFIDKEKIVKHMFPPGPDTKIVVCGPWTMCQAVKKVLVEEVGYDQSMVYSFM